MKITQDIKYIGVNDHQIDLFESMYKVPNGMSYNSYVIMDEKIAVMDTVDENFTKQWLENLESALEGRKPDYLIVHHMEPDHSANIVNLVKKYPEIIIVASAKAFTMMQHFFGTNFSDKKIVVSDGDMLSLGKHKLVFETALMVHWPEVIVTYDCTDKVLFSADAFGKFGALDKEEDWTCEARRYYFGIVGKYGLSVQKLLKKLTSWDIQKICPLHGPVLDEEINRYISFYDTWSSYRPEKEGVLIAYTSVYGNTRNAVMYLSEKLKENGYPEVKITDLARCDMTKAVADAFCYSKLILATTTYNTMPFPFMREFIMHLTERNFCNREIGFIENGSWAPVATKGMRELFANSKGIVFMENSVKIMSALNKESKSQIDALVEEICRDIKNMENDRRYM